ncbi:MAG: hypothetical protein HYU80_02050 [Candidatus Blackburnbacteria bacterium]|nr:hypothetical protein [Candidatus Blackburnbacteria bacterium]
MKVFSLDLKGLFLVPLGSLLFLVMVLFALSGYGIGWDEPQYIIQGWAWGGKC